mmetsp:Transcript_60772/g.156617  ORF Transcript_60772/g.156617 Transcript_60772/m.156617 type:complete len:188 (-) Transcript_60772:70-633(-)
MGAKIINKRLPKAEVVSCVRIEDSELWGIYTARRAEIRARTPVVDDDLMPETSQSIDYSANTTLDHSVNEMWLLHGTTEKAAEALSKSSFIPGTGGCFGAGVYFADDARKSNSYAKVAPDGNKIMLMCRVTLGNIKKLPKGSDMGAHRYKSDPNVDCILGDTGHREFVVYDTAQVYPEYIMRYKSSP